MLALQPSFFFHNLLKLVIHSFSCCSNNSPSHPNVTQQARSSQHHHSVSVGGREADRPVVLSGAAQGWLCGVNCCPAHYISMVSVSWSQSEFIVLFLWRRLLLLYIIFALHVALYFLYKKFNSIYIETYYLCRFSFFSFLSLTKANWQYCNVIMCTNFSCSVWHVSVF